VQGKAWVRFKNRSQATGALQAIKAGNISFHGNPLTGEYDVRALEAEGKMGWLLRRGKQQPHSSELDVGPRWYRYIYSTQRVHELYGRICSDSTRRSECVLVIMTVAVLIA
jgi:hypothetical protein